MTMVEFMKLMQMPEAEHMHEIVGHAIPIIVGTDTGNAIQNENKARKQYKEKDQVGESPLRKADPTHTETRRTTTRTR